MREQPSITRSVHPWVFLPRGAFRKQIKKTFELNEMGTVYKLVRDERVTRGVNTLSDFFGSPYDSTFPPDNMTSDQRREGDKFYGHGKTPGKPLIAPQTTIAVQIPLKRKKRRSTWPNESFGLFKAEHCDQKT